MLKGNNTLYLYQLTSIFECIHHVITKLQGDKYFNNTENYFYELSHFVKLFLVSHFGSQSKMRNKLLNIS